MPNKLKKFVITNKLYRSDLGRNSRETLEALLGHFDYMQALRESGEVIMAGGFMDGSGGMDIAEVTTLDQALEIAHNDPLMVANFVTQEIREWQTDIVARRKYMQQGLASLA